MDRSDRAARAICSRPAASRRRSCALPARLPLATAAQQPSSPVRRARPRPALRRTRDPYAILVSESCAATNRPRASALRAGCALPTARHPRRCDRRPLCSPVERPRLQPARAAPARRLRGRRARRLAARRRRPARAARLGPYTARGRVVRLRERVAPSTRTSAGSRERLAARPRRSCPSDRHSDWNQAAMELGARSARPRAALRAARRRPGVPRAGASRPHRGRRPARGRARGTDRWAARARRAAAGEACRRSRAGAAGARAGRADARPDRPGQP